MWPQRARRELRRSAPLVVVVVRVSAGVGVGVGLGVGVGVGADALGGGVGVGVGVLADAVEMFDVTNYVVVLPKVIVATKFVTSYFWEYLIRIRYCKECLTFF